MAMAGPLGGSQRFWGMKCDAMSESVIRLLLLHAEYTDRLSYYADWLDAFHDAPEFQVVTFNPVLPYQAATLRRLLNEVDAVVLLHSTNGDTTVYLERYADILAERKIPLLSFVGNELNLPGSPIAGKRRLFERIRPEWVATQLLEEAGRYLFGDVATRGVVAIPHALNTAIFQSRTPHERRRIDIGSRTARYVAHLGDDDRSRIVSFFEHMGLQNRLVVDISDARHDRAGWAAFLDRCKGTVATEAGSWYLERDDATVKEIRRHTLKQARGLVIPNDSPLRTLAHKLPWRYRSLMRKMLRRWPLRHESALNEQLSHENIRSRFFPGKPKPPVYGKCISSRHFDAIGTRTCQIMFRGRFNDILVADQHYLALNDDFSNSEDVLARFQDTNERLRIADQAYEHVMAGHTYRHRMKNIYGILSQSK
jgi:hypothetical protein